MELCGGGTVCHLNIQRNLNKFFIPYKNMTLPLFKSVFIR